MSLDSSDKLLVIAPHPDDEVIGCGGLIQKVKKAGGKVYVIFLTNGTTNDFSKNGPSTENERDEEIKKVSKFLDFDDYHIAFEGNDFHLKLDTIGQKKIMDMIERESPISIEKIKPTIVVFPSVTMSLAYFGETRLMTGLMSAVWMWLGFIMPVQFTDVLFSKKPVKLFGINTGYRLISLLVMGVVISLIP